MHTELFMSAKNLLLTTFRKDGTPVATPVWFVINDGELHTTTLESAGKLKRIRNNARVTVAACTVRGTPIGPTFSADARILPLDASRRAVKAVDKRYAWGRVLHVVERLVHRKRFTGVAISALTPLAATDVTDITPAQGDAGSQPAAGAAR
jgi:PPOX class probable F420-dependent enzyme